MSQQELLKRVVRVLEDGKIPYMITGAVASSLKGEPRSTHDIDIVVDIKPSSIDALIQAFPAPEFYLQRESILDAIQRQDMFNLIHIKEGDKIDFWVLKNRPFDQSSFKRRKAEVVYGKKLMVASAEDIILAKLNWSKLSGGSEKQFGDAKSVYEVQYHKLDLAYIEKWAPELDIKDLWERLKQEAEIV